jgi:hypothetical protein
METLNYGQKVHIALPAKVLFFHVGNSTSKESLTVQEGPCSQLYAKSLLDISLISFERMQLLVSYMLSAIPLLVPTHLSHT